MERGRCGPSFLPVASSPAHLSGRWGVTYNPARKSSPPLPADPHPGTPRYKPPDPFARTGGQAARPGGRAKGRPRDLLPSPARRHVGRLPDDIDNSWPPSSPTRALPRLVMDKVWPATWISSAAHPRRAEVIILGDDYASNHGPMISPGPCSATHPPPAPADDRPDHEEGRCASNTPTEYLYSLLEMIVSAGPRTQPREPVAGMELSDQQLVAGRVCLVGNIDCGRSCRTHGGRSPPGRAPGDRRRAPVAPYILSSSNSIHSSCTQTTSLPWSAPAKIRTY